MSTLKTVHLFLPKWLGLGDGNRKALNLSKDRKYLKINILKSQSHDNIISLGSG